MNKVFEFDKIKKSLNLFLLDLFRHKHTVYEKDASNKTLLYKGSYSHGSATYEYKDSECFRIFNGIFTYRNTFKTLNKIKGKEVVTGSYSNNKKSDLWVYRCDENKIKRRLKVEYTHGLQSGIYEYHRKGSDYGFRRKDSDTYIHVLMNNGHPAGFVNAFIDNSVITGACDFHGYPDGTWRMNIENDTKHLIYYEVWNHGLMVDHYCIDTTTGDKYNEKIDIFIKIKCFVKYECYPIESIIKKGSVRWHGDIFTRKNRGSLEEGL